MRGHLKIGTLNGPRAVLCLLVVLVLLQTPARAEPVSLTVSDDAGFARIELAFSSPPRKADVRIENGVLVAEFDRRVEAELAELLERIPDYIALVRQDGRGRIIRLALKQDLRLHVSEADNRVAIDLLPRRFRGEPEDIKPKLSQEEIEARKKAEEIAARDIERGPVEIQPLAVHIGQQKDFTRISFLWPEPVAYTATLDNSRVTVTFQKPADPDLVELRVGPPQFVRGAEKIQAEDHLTVQLLIDPESGLRHFREGNTIVLDILAPKESDGELLGADANALLQAEKVDAAPRQHAPEESTVSPEAPESKEHAPAEAQSALRTTLVMPQKAASHNPPADTRRDGHEPPSESPVADEHGTAEPAEHESGDADSPPPPALLPERAAPAAHEADTAAHDPAASDEPDSGPGEETDPVHALPAKESETAAEAAEPHDGADEAVTAAPPLGPDRIKVVGYDQGEALRLTFRWGYDVPAAVFRRGDYLWLVFDNTQTDLDFSDVDREYRKYIYSIESSITGRVRLVRLGVSRKLLVTAQAEAGAWIITLGEKIVKPVVPLELRPAVNYRFQPIIDVAFDGHGPIHKIIDPEIGDELTIVTGRGPARGLVASRYFVEFTALSSAHGLVLQFLSDDMFARATEEGIEIGRTSGLSLSDHELQTVQGERPALGLPYAPAFMDFKTWRLGPFDEFADHERELIADIARASQGGNGSESELARLKLARFYLANAMGPEALGILDLIARQDEEAITDPAFLALRGVAYFLSNRYHEALEDFSASVLNEDADAALWRGMILSHLERFTEARRAFVDGENNLSRYTYQWQSRFRLAAAKAALGVNDIEQADAHLSKVLPERATPSVLAEAELLRGELLEALGREEEAIRHYEQVIRNGPEPVAVRARFAEIQARYRTKNITVDQAINALEELRFQWRGDSLELNVLKRLGELYVDQGKYRHGLNIMRQTLLSYPDAPTALAISNSMATIFKKLFLEESFNDMSPVQALAVYYEFKELTPVGRDGDDMIRKLADRLIDVDLLEQAAELLDHQVKNRLRGAARSQVATRLAIVYLMDRKPELALQTLRNTRQAGLPKALVVSRRLLEARALTELGRYAHALELIEPYDSDQADQIREDVFWKSQDWEKAAHRIEKRLGERWQDDKPLNDYERTEVMRAAVAFSLAEDQEGLDRLRVRYGQKMAASSDGDAFAIVTDDIDKQGLAFRNLASSIASIDTLEGFMENFRKQFQIDAGNTALN